MDDIQTYIIVLIIVLVIAYIITRSQSRTGSSGNYEDYQDGSEGPYYDDPDIEGRGSFGRDRGSPTGRSMGRDAGQPRQDSPNIRGRGSFGKDKG